MTSPRQQLQKNINPWFKLGEFRISDLSQRNICPENTVINKFSLFETCFIVVNI